MCPIPPLFDLLYRVKRDSVFFSEEGIRTPLIFDEGNNSIFGYLTPWIGLSLEVATPSSIPNHPVGGVIFGGPASEMREFAARRPVTGMKNIKATWNWSNKLSPNNPMDESSSPLIAHPSIPACIGGAGPKATSLGVWRSEVELNPFFDRAENLSIFGEFESHRDTLCSCEHGDSK